MDGWVELGFWTSLAHQAKIAKSIATYGHRLDSMHRQFQVRIRIERTVLVIKWSNCSKTGAMAKVGLMMEGGGLLPGTTIHDRQRAIAPDMSGHDVQQNLDTTSVSYEESSRRDRHDTVLEFARSDFDSRREEIVDVRNTGEANNIGQALGQVIDDVRFRKRFSFDCTMSTLSIIVARRIVECG